MTSLRWGPSSCSSNAAFSLSFSTQKCPQFVGLLLDLLFSLSTRLRLRCHEEQEPDADSTLLCKHTEILDRYRLLSCGLPLRWSS